jgi:hypothetical protein
MPTVLTLSGLRVTIYPNDHRPAHVHVIGHGCEAVFKLHCPNGKPELRENYDFSKKELSQIAQCLIEHHAFLCEEWRKLHHDY